MDVLEIKATSTTPEINFHPETNLLSISGEIYPENVASFFDPILSWLENYLKETSGPIICNTNITYFNTSSSKYLFYFFDMLNEAHSNGKSVTVNWYFEDDDEMTKECGEEFQEDLELPFNLVVQSLGTGST